MDTVEASTSQADEGAIAIGSRVEWAIGHVKSRRQFLFYALIGCSGVVLDLVLFFVLFNVGHLNKNLSTFLSTTAGIANNFTLNAWLNFKTTDRIVLRFIKFYAVGATGIILTLVMFKVLVDWAGLNANAVKVLSLLPVLVMQYGLNKIWTFK